MSLSKAPLAIVCSLSLLLSACNEPVEKNDSPSISTPEPSNLQTLDGFEGELISCTKADLKNAPFFKKLKKRGPLQPEDAFLEEIEVYNITYLSNGKKINGFLTLPKTREALPCILLNHAFYPKRNVINLPSAARVMGLFASKGYAVFASNYSGLGGSEGSYEFGGTDVDDVLNLLEAAGEIPGVDTSSAGLIGLQRGGLINLIALRKSARFDCALNMNGVVSLESMVASIPKLEGYLSKTIPNYESERDEALAKRTPARWAESMHPTPVLFVHRQDDSLSKVSDVESLCQAMKQNDHPYHLITLLDKKSLTKHREETFEHCFQWLDSHLKNQTTFSLTGNKTVIND